MPRLSFGACVFPQLRWHTPIMFKLLPQELIKFIYFGREISEPKQAWRDFLWTPHCWELQKQWQRGDCGRAAGWALRQERVTACTAFSVCSSRQNPERDNDVSTTSRPRAPCLTMWAIQHIPICHNRSIHAPISWPLWIKTCGVKYTSSPVLMHLHCTRNRLTGNWLQLLPPDTWDLCQRCHQEKHTLLWLGDCTVMYT